MSGYLYSDQVWVIFNHIYDVQTGVNAAQEIHCGGGTCCCDLQPHTCCDSTQPTYGLGRLYVIGNVFNHIQPFGHPTPGNVGQAVGIGSQVQARVINNTIYKCSQGVTIGCMHDSGNPNDCPPYTDPNNLTRNTSVSALNNVVLDTPDNGGNDCHVRVCTGPPANPFTLTDHEFDRSLHYGTARAFVLPTGTYDSVEGLQDAPYTDYGLNSEGDNVPGDNPNFFDTGKLLFYLRATAPASPTFMFNRGIKDSAYSEFQTAFPSFPHIYRDYAGNEYPDDDYCAIGAFGTVR